MKRLTYPVCTKCDAEINPHKYEDCEQYYLVEGENMCKDCFKDWLLDWIQTNLDEVAFAIGVPVVEV